MKPLGCLIKHQYCSFIFNSDDYIICQRCGHELKTPIIDQKKLEQELQLDAYN